MNTISRIERTLSHMILRPQLAFWAMIALRLPQEIDETGTAKTARTNGRRVQWNPAFVESLTDAELLGVLSHEVAHVALMHHLRRGSREPKLWNEACDYAINPALQAAGLTLPAGALTDARFADMSEEAIYDVLTTQQQQQQPGQQQPGQQQPQQQPQQPGQQPGAGASMGEVEDMPNEDGSAMDSSQMEAERQKLVPVLIQAARQAKKMAGDLPGAAERFVRAVTHPRIPWQRYAHRFIESIFPADYTYARRDRRFIHRGLYLPGVIRENVGTLGIGVDTSGSMTQQELDAAAAEITGLVKILRPSKIIVFICDKVLHDTLTFSCDEPLRFPLLGGGGTSFEPVMEAAAAVPDLKGLIYFTDLKCSRWGRAPRCPVLWVCNNPNHGTVPFGEVVLF